MTLSFPLQGMTGNLGEKRRHLTPAMLTDYATVSLRHSRTNAGFTLVEIMIVVAIISLLASIAVPGFLRARKRSQASRILNDLRMIDSAVDQYAIENNKLSGATVPIAGWTPYVKKDTPLYLTGKDLYGNAYGGQTVDTLPIVPADTFNTLSDVANSLFFSPFRVPP